MRAWTAGLAGVCLVLAGCGRLPAEPAPEVPSTRPGTVTPTSALASAPPATAPAVPRPEPARGAALAPAGTGGVPRTAFGDSVMLGSAAPLRHRGFRVDAQVSRQFAAVLPLLRGAAAAGSLRTNVVVDLGTNGTITLADCRAAVRLVGPARRLFLVTVHVPRPWMAGDNRTLRRCAASYRTGRAVLVDWAALSAGHRSWFAPDGFHPSATGRPHYYDLIDATVDRLGLR